jgi:hypothetical protein
MKQPNEKYLGDGLYASYDGWQFRLRAPRENGDHVVYLSQGMVELFNEFCKKALLHPTN